MVPNRFTSGDRHAELHVAARIRIDGELPIRSIDIDLLIRMEAGAGHRQLPAGRDRGLAQCDCQCVRRDGRQGPYQPAGDQMHIETVALIHRAQVGGGVVANVAGRQAQGVECLLRLYPVLVVCPDKVEAARLAILHQRIVLNSYGAMGCWSGRLH